MAFGKLGIGLLAATCLVSATAAQAADAQGASATSGVTSFPSAFFADARPNTAMDMVNRIPGFVFDGGAQVRGFSEGAGNVVIDGQRPTSKQDGLESILRRIPAGQVERIDLIRGGDRAIDMQGRTLIANVVRKKDGVRQLVVTLVDDWTPSTGKQAPILKLEATRERDGVRTEASLVTGAFIDNGSGDGRDTFTDNPAVRPAGTCVTSCVLRLRARAGGLAEQLAARSRATARQCRSASEHLHGSGGGLRRTRRLQQSPRLHRAAHQRRSGDQL